MAFTITSRSVVSGSFTRRVATVTCCYCGAALVVDLPGPKLMRLVSQLEAAHSCVSVPVA